MGTRVVLYELLVGRPAFEAQSPAETAKRIQDVDLHYPGFISSGAKNLISKVNVLPTCYSHYQQCPYSFNFTVKRIKTLTFVFSVINIYTG